MEDASASTLPFLEKKLLFDSNNIISATQTVCKYFFEFPAKPRDAPVHTA